MEPSKPTLVRRLADGVTMFVVMWVSMLCLIYVAYGEAVRTYERFQGDKLSGQAHILQNSMESFLRSGLPLKQFVGFNTLAEPMLDSDNTISSIVVYDSQGERLFAVGDLDLVDGMSAPATRPNPDADNIVRIAPDHIIEVAGASYRVIVPLANKFERVGSMTVTMPMKVVEERVRSQFEPILKYSAAPAAFFALLIAVFGGGLHRSRMLWPQISFAMIFLASASIVVAALINLYSDGAQTKARALAESLGQRLSDLVEFNLNLSEIDGLDRTFGEYLRVNPDLSSASLAVDGKIIIHTDPSQLGSTWRSDAANYQYIVDLTPHDNLRDIKVAVELPSDVVFAQIMRSVKNFAALFIASAFLAQLFFQVGGAVRLKNSGGTEEAMTESRQSVLVSYLSPVFFLGVLAEHLTYAFLPQHVHELAEKAGVSEALAASPFTIFYLMFALTLIPAGYMAQRFSPRPLMYLGLVMAGGGMFAMSAADDFWSLVASRAASGVGQGMLFIGVQSYLLAVSSSNNKTQAAAVIVYGFQGGMISGMAVGSLLVQSMGREGVFALGALITCVAAAYAIVTVPALARDALKPEAGAETGGLLRGIGKAMRNARFMNAMISIGMPAKAVLTGVISFALPLLLASAAYPQEDIGQIIMIYALAVVISSRFVAPQVDRIGDARMVLFQGTTLSGIGLLLVAAAGVFAAPLEQHYGAFGSTGLLIAGIAMIGIAHGFINAPVVTYIAQSQLARDVGAGTATSTYRFLERVGHVAGPMLVGQLFLIFNDDWTSIGFVGAMVLVLGLIFLAGSDSSDAEGADRTRPKAA